MRKNKNYIIKLDPDSRNDKMWLYHKKLILNYISPWPQRVKKRISYIDYDYVDQLNLEEHDFLVRFTGEYYGGGFDEFGDLNPDRKECYNRNNAINRDVFTTYTVLQKLHYFGNLQELDVRFYKAR